MNPLDAMGHSPSVLERMRGLTEPVWDRPTEERQLPKLGGGRPSREIMRERARLAKLGYLVPGTEEKDAENHPRQVAHQPAGERPTPSPSGDPTRPAPPVAEAPPATRAEPKLGSRERAKLLRYAEQMQESIDRMTRAGAWHSVAYQTAKRDEWLRLANGG